MTAKSLTPYLCEMLREVYPERGMKGILLLQFLRGMGFVEFLGGGNYRLT